MQLDSFFWIQCVPNLFPISKYSKKKSISNFWGFTVPWNKPGRACLNKLSNLTMCQEKHKLPIRQPTLKWISNKKKLCLSGPQIRVRNWKLFFLFLNQNICCGYSNEPSRWDGSFEHPKQMLKLMDKKIIAILRKLFLLNWPYVCGTLCLSIDVVLFLNDLHAG